MVALLLAAGAVGTAPEDHAAGRRRTSSPSEPAPASLTATCRFADHEHRIVIVVTGVGLALREVRFTVAGGCRITVAEAPGGLQDLQPGAILRIGYRTAGDDRVAEAIDVLPKAGSEGRR